MVLHTYPDNNLSFAASIIKHPVFCDHYNLPFLHMLLCVFFALLKKNLEMKGKL